MNYMTIVKQIHKTLRENGYERRHSTFEVGPKVYKSYVDMIGGSIHISIPGNWSIPLQKKFKKSLMETLKEFKPIELYDIDVAINLNQKIVYDIL